MRSGGTLGWRGSRAALPAVTSWLSVPTAARIAGAMLAALMLGCTGRLVVADEPRGLDLAIAIEDAMVVAARKHYKTEEDLRAKFNQETGQVDVFTVHTVVEEVTDPKKEISLTDAKKKNPSAEIGTEIERLAALRAELLVMLAAMPGPDCPDPLPGTWCAPSLTSPGRR